MNFLSLLFLIMSMTPRNSEFHHDPEEERIFVQYLCIELFCTLALVYGINQSEIMMKLSVKLSDIGGWAIK